MKASTKTKSSHAVFWGLLKNVPGYNEAFKNDIKASFVREASGGKTESLSELLRTNKRAYFRMIEGMKHPSKGVKDRSDAQRKKLLQLIYKFCEHKGYQLGKEQALKIACKACGVSRLNASSEQHVIAAIKAFEKNESVAWVSSVLSKIS